MVTPNEQRITLKNARRRIPGRPSYETVWRWCRHGRQGVRLEYLRVGRAMYTSVEALERFFQRVTAVDMGEPLPEFDTSNPAHEQAERELAESGY